MRAGETIDQWVQRAPLAATPLYAWHGLFTAIKDVSDAHHEKRNAVRDDLQALRGAAKIQYVGDFARTPAEAASAASDALEVKAGPSPLTATPASAPEPLVPVRPASAPTGARLDKGIQGLK